MPRAARHSAPASEAGLLLGLLGDLLHIPVALLRELRSRRGEGDLLRPFLAPLSRLLSFAAAARVTCALLVLNLAGFSWEIGARLGGMGEAAFLRRFSLRPSDLAQGNWLPLAAHLFSHAGWAHLLGNLLTLLVFGRAVERRLGSASTLVTYLGAACVSTALSMAAQIALHKDVPTLGASGAVAGLVALGTLLSPFTLTFEAIVPMPLFLVGWLAIAADLMATLAARQDGIDHFAHLGGYLSVLLGLLFLAPAQRRAARAGLVLHLATIAAALFWLALRATK